MKNKTTNKYQSPMLNQTNLLSVSHCIYHCYVLFSIFFVVVGFGLCVNQQWSIIHKYIFPDFRVSNLSIYMTREMLKTFSDGA